MSDARRGALAATSAAEMLEVQADRLGERPYLRCGEQDWISYAELDERSGVVAAGLQELGVKRGDRVLILSANSVEVAETIFACSKLGAVQVPINTYLRGSFLQHQVDDSGAVVAVADAQGLRSLERLGSADKIEHLVVTGECDDGHHDCLAFAQLYNGGTPLRSVRPGPSELAAIMYTSGTTGLAKGCMIPHGMFVSPMATYSKAGYVQSGDRVLTPSPLFHMGCQSAMLMAPLANDASACFVERFSASDFMPRARKVGATVLYGVGAAAIAILRQPPHEEDSINRLRCAVWTPLAADQADEFERRFGVRTTTEAYGQTEFLPISLGNVEANIGRGGVGAPVEIAEVCVLDDRDRPVEVGEVGEIAVRPRQPDVMSIGYWGIPEASLHSISNLWHHTGDLGRLDEEGRLSIIDRKVDALRRRGENVSSSELEGAIRRHPGVDDVAVFGVPSAMSEDDIMACIRTTSERTVTPAELFEFFRRELPYFAIPRYVDLVTEFPVNALGRIRKDLLRKAGVTPSTWDLEALGFTVTPQERR